MNSRTASVYFKPDPHRDGWNYREGYWVYQQGDDEHQFEKFTQGYGEDAESFAQRQLDLDEVDVVYIYSKTGDLRYSKQGIQYKDPDEILKIAKKYLRSHTKDREQRSKLYLIEMELERIRLRSENLEPLYNDCKDKADKFDKLKEVLA